MTFCIFDITVNDQFEGTDPDKRKDRLKISKSNYLQPEELKTPPRNYANVSGECFNHSQLDLLSTAKLHKNRSKCPNDLYNWLMFLQQLMPEKPWSSLVVRVLALM